MKILVATNNQAKLERYRRLLQNAGRDDVELVSLADEDITVINIEENQDTLLENAELKARTYAEFTDLPVIANDTGLWVADRGFLLAPKREALAGDDEKQLTKEQIYDRLLHYYKNIATKNGGQVEAAFVGEFVLITPGGIMYHAQARREITITDTVYGKINNYMPVRALYISKDTGKPGLHHTSEEELIEMGPVLRAIEALVDKVV